VLTAVSIDWRAFVTGARGTHMVYGDLTSCCLPLLCSGTAQGGSMFQDAANMLAHKHATASSSSSSRFQWQTSPATASCHQLRPPASCYTDGAQPASAPLLDRPPPTAPRKLSNCRRGSASTWAMLAGNTNLQSAEEFREGVSGRGASCQPPEGSLWHQQ